MAVILLRHTAPDIAEGICYGQTDLDVLQSFDAEAAEIARLLPPFHQIVTSPLQRCRKLAQVIARTHACATHIEPRLAEMDFGTWEGQAWSGIKRCEIDAWAADFLNARPHGGESVAQVRARVLQVLNDWHDLDKITLMVTHAGVIRAALSTGDTPEDFSTQIAFGAHVCLP